MSKHDPMVGPIGEEIVSTFLMKHGYQIIDRNFRRPWGELDVVAEKAGIIHFVEVKTVTNVFNGVTHETTNKDSYRPEDNVHFLKTRRLSRVIRSFLAVKHVSDETSWQFDVATVLLDQRNRKAKVKMLENLIF